MLRTLIYLNNFNRLCKINTIYLLLTSFVSNIVNILSFEELKKLDDFLNCNDEDINNYYINKIPIKLFDNKKILDLFINHKIK